MAAGGCSDMASSLGIRPRRRVTLAAVAPYADGVSAPQPRRSGALRALNWARRTFELIPTPWLITASGAVLLGTTAAFGGLDAVAEPPLPELAIGDEYSGADFTFTVRAIELRADNGTTFVFPDEENGEQVLAVVVEVVNDFPVARALSTTSKLSSTVDGIAVEGLDAKPVVTRVDGSAASMLQPDVPAELVLAWVVPRGAYEEGDTVTLSLPDATHYVGTSVVSGDYWWDVTVGATVTGKIVEIPAPEELP